MYISRRAIIAGSLSATLAGRAMGQSPRPIELWSFLDPKQENIRSKALAHVISTFEAANPGFQVRTSVIQWQELSPQLLRGARAGRTPDVAMLFSPTLGAHLAAGTLQSLDPLLRGTDKDDLIVLPAGHDKAGSLRAVPWEMRVTGLLYRQDFLDKAGLSMPRSLDELVQVGQMVGTDRIAGFAVGFRPTQASDAIEWLVATIAGLGGKVLNEDGSAAFVSSQWERVVGFVHEAVHRYKVLPRDIALQGGEDLQENLNAGLVAFIPRPSNRVELTRQRSGVGTGYQMARVPLFEPGRTAPAVVQGWTLAIPTAAREAEGALALIRHWTSAEMQEHQVKVAGYMPVRRSTSTSQALAGPDRQYIRDMIEYASNQPLVVQWPENVEFLHQTLGRSMEQVVTSAMSPRAAAEWAEQTYNAARK